MNAVRMAVRQGTPAWLLARRTLITSTDLPVLLGISPYKCEADLADEKLTGVQQPATIRMLIGIAAQPFIGAEYTRLTGRPVRPVRDMWRHPEIEWAAASPDFTAPRKRLVEAKRTSSRTRFADGIPQDVEAQVAWALGVSGYPVADIAVLLGDDELLSPIPEQPADPRLFADLVAIAEDFRARLAAGGPFSRDANRIKRDHPADDGSDLIADEAISEAVLELLRLRAQSRDIEKAQDAIETAVKARMADAARLIGNGWQVTWKRTKDVETIDWKSIADGLLRQLPETERTALVGLATTARPGFRPFRVVVKEVQE